MNTISINEIFDALEYFENKNFDAFEEQKFLAGYPNILSFLTSSQFDTLSEDEYLILMFNAVVLIKAFQNKFGKCPDPDQQLIEESENENWDKFESLGNISFEDKIYALFEVKNAEIADYILSSFEDEEDEEQSDEINQIVREIISVSLKSIIDAIVNTLN